MCKRTTRDPLLRILLDRYQLHLLAVPREAVHVGDLYVETAGQVSPPGNVKHLLSGELTLPPLRAAEPMASISGLTTRGVEAKHGLDLLEGMLSALAGPTEAASIRAEYE